MEHTVYSVCKNNFLLECFSLLYVAILKFLGWSIFELLITAEYSKFLDNWIIFASFILKLKFVFLMFCSEKGDAAEDSDDVSILV